MTVKRRFQRELHGAHRARVLAIGSGGGVTLGRR